MLLKSKYKTVAPSLKPRELQEKCGKILDPQHTLKVSNLSMMPKWRNLILDTDQGQGLDPRATKDLLIIRVKRKLKKRV